MQSSRMTLDLIIDATHWPFDDEHVIAASRQKSLGALLARGDTRYGAASTLEDDILARCGIDARRTPVAALCALGDGVTPGRDYWLRLDPVCLQATRTRMRLATLPPGDLTNEHARALAQLLAPHFAAYGYELVVAHPQRWYLRCATTLDLVTHNPASCVGWLTSDQLPSGRDGGMWRQLVTEAQMLLHESEPNAARERAGKLSVNAVWPWGGGSLPDIPKPPYRQVSADHPLARGIALAAGVAVSMPPDSASDLIASTPGAQSVLVALAARASAASDQFDAWEARWFSPLLHALRHTRLAALRLTLCHPDRTLRSDILPWHLLRLWRRAFAPAHHA